MVDKKRVYGDERLALVTLVLIVILAGGLYLWFKEDDTVDVIAVETTAPTPEVLETITIQSDMLDDETIRLFGKTVPNTDISLFMDNNNIGSSFSDSDGDWFFVTLIDENAHQLFARIEPDGKHTRADSKLLQIDNRQSTNTQVATSNTTIKEAPVEEASIEPTASPEMTIETAEAPQFNKGTNGIIQEPGVYNVRGTAPVGTQLYYELPNNPAGYAEVNESGEWIKQLDFSQTGIYTLRVTTANPVGDLVSETRLARIYIVPDLEYPAPNMDEQMPTLEQGVLTLTGGGTPNTMVMVQTNGQPFGSSLVGSDGRWSITAEIAPNYYEIRAMAHEPNNPIILSVSEPLYLEVK